jgi:polysaccharide pyruvyl transferase WcaK-like protein
MSAMPISPTSDVNASALCILVVSSGGVSNHGDDAVLLSTLERLKRLRPGSVPVVITDGDRLIDFGLMAAWGGTIEEFAWSIPPEEIGRGCIGHPVLAASLPERVRAGSYVANRTPISSFDLVVFCGGGYWAHFWPELTARRTAIAAAAIASGVPYLVSGQGLGPLSPEVAQMLALFAGGAARFGVRDPLSAELLQGIPLRCGSAEIVGDDALGLAPIASKDLEQRLRQAGVPAGQALLGFHAREAPGYMGFNRDSLHATARIVDSIAAMTQRHVITLPINSRPTGPEVELMVDLVQGLGRPQASWHLLDCRNDIPALASLIGCCQAVVTHSFHVALFALERRVPAIMPVSNAYYRCKARGLAQFFEIPRDIVMVGGSDATTVCNQLEEIAQILASNRGNHAQKVEEWFDRALPANLSARSARAA